MTYKAIRARAVGEKKKMLKLELPGTNNNVIVNFAGVDGAVISSEAFRWSQL